MCGLGGVLNGGAERVKRMTHEVQVSISYGWPHDFRHLETEGNDRLTVPHHSPIQRLTRRFHAIGLIFLSPRFRYFTAEGNDRLTGKHDARGLVISRTVTQEMHTP